MKSGKERKTRKSLFGLSFRLGYRLYDLNEYQNARIGVKQFKVGAQKNRKRAGSISTDFCGWDHDTYPLITVLFK
jgi:hypothetical protein